MRLTAVACLALTAMLFAQQAEDTLETVVVSSPEEVHPRMRDRVGKFLAELPEGSKVQVTIGQYFDSGQDTSSNQMQPYVYSIVPVDRRNRPDGEELFFKPGGHAAHRIVPWKEGERRGVERHLEGWGRNRRAVVEIPWEDDRVHGVKKTYYPDGTLRSETHYHKGDAHGPSRTYDREGNLTRESNMHKGLRDGVMKDYWPGSTQIKRVIEYRDGKVHGKALEYYRSGVLKREMAFRNDRMHGEEKQYDGEGKLETTRYWIDGEAVAPGEFKERF
jgi:antitoxin component YwqK of YwqJK toxin-antitoxin module